jgi:hypothetical protein
VNDPRVFLAERREAGRRWRQLVLNYLLTVLGITVFVGGVLWFVAWYPKSF